MYIIAVDIGTSRIKAAVFTADGVMLSLADRRIDRAASPDYQNAVVWSDALDGALRELTCRYRPDAVVLTGNMHALLGVDHAGTPVAPALLWCDSSSAPESDLLNARYGAELGRRFGNSCIPVFTLPKMWKMRRENPDLYRRSAFFLQSKDYIMHRLTGVFATDPSDASGTLAMRLTDQTWDDGLLKELGLDAAKMPPILPSSSIGGHVTKEAASRTGLAAGTPVVCGCGDLMSAAIGSGVDDDTFSLTLGTAGQLLAAGKCGEGEKLFNRLFVFAHAVPGRELYLGSVPGGGFCFEFLAKLHNISMDEFFAAAAKGEGANDGELPVFLPYILGKGAPYMDYRAAGAWFGLNASHRIESICRGAVLGTLSALRESADVFAQCGINRSRMVLQSLAVREKAVRECAAALFAQRKFATDNSEASLTGALCLGLSACGVYPDAATAARNLLKFSPVPDAEASGAAAYYQHYRDCAALV